MNMNKNCTYAMAAGVVLVLGVVGWIAFKKFTYNPKAAEDAAKLVYDAAKKAYDNKNGELVTATENTVTAKSAHEAAANDATKKKTYDEKKTEQEALEKLVKPLHKKALLAEGQYRIAQAYNLDTPTTAADP